MTLHYFGGVWMTSGHFWEEGDYTADVHEN